MTIQSPPRKPATPPNRVLREGERPCPICGCGEAQHRHERWEPAPLGHAYPFTRLARVIATIVMLVWPNRRSMYILGEEFTKP